jgi:glycosyltransferase involved in cell wall biosynthesis
VKKILIVCDFFPPNVYGGAEISTLEIAKHLTSKFKVDVFTTVNQPHKRLLTSKFEDINIFSIYTRNIKYFSNYSVVFRLKAFYSFFLFLKKNKYDLIHYNNIGYKLSFSIILISNFLKIPSIITFRDATAIVNGKFNRGLESNNMRVSVFNELKRNKFNFNPIRNFLIKKILQRTDYKIAISNILKNLLEFNGININQTYYNRIYLNKDIAKISYSNQYILYTGRPSIDKGFFDVIKLMKFINNEYSLNLLIIGFGKEELPDLIINYINENQLNNIIEFKQWIPQKIIHSFISNSIIVIFPSKYIDAFGRVILESLLTNTPVLASKYAGASELIAD